LADEPPKLLPPATIKSGSRVRFPVALVVVTTIVLVGAGAATWWLSGSEPAPPAPAAPSAPPSADSDLSRKVDRLRADLDALKEQPAPQAEPDAQVEALRNEVASLGRRLDATATAADPQALAAQAEAIHALESRVAAAETKLAERRADTRNQRSLVLAAVEIETALANSAPYRDAVELIRSAAGQDEAVAADLAILDRHAVTGVESRVRLAQDLAMLPGRLSAPQPAPADAGFGERMMDRLTGIVRIRRVDEDPARPAGPPGPDRIVAEAETRLAAGDLAGAIDSVRSLDGQAATLATPWTEAATARLEAERAAQSLAATLTKRLAAPGED